MLRSDKKTGTMALICELMDLNIYELIKGKKKFFIVATFIHVQSHYI